MLLISNLFLACQNNAQNDSYYYGSSNLSSQQNNRNNQIEMKPIVDSRTGRVNCYYPLPADWKLTNTNNGTQGFEGPNGIRVYSMPTESYVFNVDQYTANHLQKPVAKPVPINTIFQDRLKPAIQQQGGKLLKQYKLEEISNRSRQLLQQSLNRSTVQSYEMIISEWQQPNGGKSMIILSEGVMYSQGMGSWWVSVTELEAPATYFEQAKEAYLYALGNWQVDENTARAHMVNLNRMDQEHNSRMEQSRIAHNEKMRQNERAFQEQQRYYRSTQEDISDISMRGYWSRSDRQDRMRTNEINAIHEESTMNNPWNNQNIQVNAGYKNYYMNANGDVIGSNDLNFNPNMHKDYRHNQWKKMSLVRQ